jgi:hypothetical protein
MDSNELFKKIEPFDFKKTRELLERTIGVIDNNPAFQSVAKLTGLNVKISQDAKYIGGQMKPSYVYELEL